MASLPDGLIIEFVKTDRKGKIEMIQQELVYCRNCEKCDCYEHFSNAEKCDIEFRCTMLDTKVNSTFGCLCGRRKSS